MNSFIFKAPEFSGYQGGSWPPAPMSFRPPANPSRGFYGPRQPSFPSLGARLLYGPGSLPRWGYQGYY